MPAQDLCTFPGSMPTHDAKVLFTTRLDCWVLSNTGGECRTAANSSIVCLAPLSLQSALAILAQQCVRQISAACGSQPRTPTSP